MTWDFLSFGDHKLPRLDDLMHIQLIHIHVQAHALIQSCSQTRLCGPVTMKHLERLFNSVLQVGRVP